MGFRGSARDWMVPAVGGRGIPAARPDRPVVHNVSAATLDLGSCAKMASSTESEIWSATLSGWPSDTDSDVNRNSLFIRLPHSRSASHSNKERTPSRHLKPLLRPLAWLPLR